MNPDDWSWVLGIPVLLPFAGAAVTLVIARHHLAQRIVSLVALGVVQLTAIFIGYLSLSGPLTLDVGGWSAPVGITLVADRLSAVMLMVSVFVTLCVLIYSFTQDLSESQRLPIAVFQPTFLILSAGVSNAFLTGDLFNLYVFMEILSLSGYALVAISGEKTAEMAAFKYLVMGAVSSLSILLGVGHGLRSGRH